MILPIRKYGDPVLRQRGRRIETITDEIRQLAADMLETMQAAHGVGLAAQQIGRPILLTVIDVRPSEQPSTMDVDGTTVDVAAQMPLVWVNPELQNPEGEQIGVEGCLSIPEVSAQVKRAATVEVEAQTLEGKRRRFRCGGLLARVAQHEVDHLHGVLFIDRIEAAARAAFAGPLKRLSRETQAALKKSRARK